MTRNSRTMTSSLNALHMEASESLRSAENLMIEKFPDIIFPVILKVPDEKRGLSGRESVRFLSQYARQAVMACAEKTGIEFSVFEKDSDGVPLPSNGVYWSLSHKPEYVAGVISDDRVGIDIEPIRPVEASLINRILDSKEQQTAGRISDEMFFRCWTAKESVLKAVGAGLKGLSQCNGPAPFNFLLLRTRYKF